MMRCVPSLGRFERFAFLWNHSARTHRRVLELHLIEVQTGAYLGEDDIVRLDDDFGRVDRFE